MYILETQRSSFYLVKTCAILSLLDQLDSNAMLQLYAPWYVHVDIGAIAQRLRDRTSKDQQDSFSMW
jgi:hypothetical protein